MRGPIRSAREGAMSSRPVQVDGGRYVLHELIGRGGGGEVYRAVDRSDGATCAVKIHPPMGDGARRVRFLNESDVLSRISSPYVVRMVAAGEEEGWLWFAMELLPGGSLRDRVGSDGPASVAQACKWALDVLLGLHTVHRAGLVHRDVKPHNVYLAADGRAVLGDFGVVRRLHDSMWRTRQGASLGTPGYRAPEQAGEAEHADQRADIYGAGATLYYLATAVRPEFLHGAIPFYPQALEPLPEVLHAPVLQACAYEPGARFADAWSMARAVWAVRDAELAALGLPPEADQWDRAFTRTLSLRERVARWLLPER